MLNFKWNSYNKQINTKSIRDSIKNHNQNTNKKNPTHFLFKESNDSDLVSKLTLQAFSQKEEILALYNLSENINYLVLSKI